MFLAGTKFYSLADLALGSLLYYLFSLCMLKQDLARTPHLTRWFTALASLKQTQAVWGNFKWCQKVNEPALVEKKDDGKKKDEGKKKEKKVEEKKGPSKEDKEKAKMEAAERELELHNQKVKAWLELPIKFDFEEFKRV